MRAANGPAPVAPGTDGWGSPGRQAMMRELAIVQAAEAQARRN